MSNLPNARSTNYVDMGRNGNFNGYVNVSPPAKHNYENVPQPGPGRKRRRPRKKQVAQVTQGTAGTVHQVANAENIDNHVRVSHSSYVNCESYSARAKKDLQHSTENISMSTESLAIPGNHMSSSTNNLLPSTRLASHQSNTRTEDSRNNNIELSIPSLQLPRQKNYKVQCMQEYKTVSRAKIFEPCHGYSYIIL